MIDVAARLTLLSICLQVKSFAGLKGADHHADPEAVCEALHGWFHYIYLPLRSERHPAEAAHQRKRVQLATSTDLPEARSGSLPGLSRRRGNVSEVAQ